MAMKLMRLVHKPWKPKPSPMLVLRITYLTQCFLQLLLEQDSEHCPACLAAHHRVGSMCHLH